MHAFNRSSSFLFTFLLYSYCAVIHREFAVHMTWFPEKVCLYCACAYFRCGYIPV